MKIAYQGIKLGAAKRGLIEQANIIIQEYLARGFTLTLRQLFYQFVSRALLPNTERSYKNLGAAIADGRLAASRELEINLQQNGYWLNRVTQALSRDEDVATAIDPRRLYDGITVESVRDAARKYLDETRYVQVILRPERP